MEMMKFSITSISFSANELKVMKLMEQSFSREASGYSWSRNSPSFMEPEGSLPSSQEDSGICTL
jgi:hypothetical protein